ncbi:MAG: Xanthomonas phage RiverRider [Pseudomonadota bacterium]|jgi:hypothetical protein
MASSLNSLEAQVNRPPEWVGGVTKNLLMTKDSAISKGLNRAVQYGDLVAKATLYDCFMAQGQPERDVLDRIMEEFVQYNRLPERGQGQAGKSGIGMVLQLQAVDREGRYTDVARASFPSSAAYDRPPLCP